MNFIKNISNVFFLIGMSFSYQAQISTFTNDDAIVYIENNASIYVEGDVLIKNTGVIDNSGIIYLENDWINNSIFNVFLNSSPGEVVFSGIDQKITGINPTLFYDLTTQNIGEKSLFSNTWVENKLDLTNSEVQLHANLLHLYNPNPGSLIWTTGFISGDSLAGYFQRTTDRIASYMFPVGGLGLLNVHRAIEITPTSSDSSVFGVRMAEINSDNDFTGTSMTGSVGPFLRTQAGPRAIKVNEKFYHNIARFYGTSNLSVKMFYFQSDEPSIHDFNNVAFWKNSIPRWTVGTYSENQALGYFNIGNPYKYMSGTITDFSNDVYSLVVKDKDDVYIPQIFSPNGDGINDILFAYGHRFESMQLVIYNRLGEMVFETTDNKIGWDGKFRGKDAQSGVYVYYLKGKILEGGNITRKGDITLVR